MSNERRVAYDDLISTWRRDDLAYRVEHYKEGAWTRFPRNDVYPALDEDGFGASYETLEAALAFASVRSAERPRNYYRVVSPVRVVCGYRRGYKFRVGDQPRMVVSV